MNICLLTHGILEIPELPATVLPAHCYAGMFRRCKNIIQVPDFHICKFSPNTINGLSAGQYYLMFESCSNLTRPPALPNTQLSDSCYKEMFKNCISLTYAPDLPATQMQKSCYYSMFQGCTNLKYGPKIFNARTTQTYCFARMFYNCINLLEAPSFNLTSITDYSCQNMFPYCSSLLVVSGNIISDQLGIDCFRQMFYRCTSLKQIPEINCHTVKSGSYLQMFAHCKSLPSAMNILPATTLAYECYQGMFYNCFQLQSAPELPATELVNNCYSNMFQGCTSLTNIKVAFTDWNLSATSSWVKDVADIGTFTCPAELQIIYGKNNIPNGWTVSNGNSSETPETPETPGGTTLTVSGVSNLPYASAIDTYNYADGTYTLQSGTGAARIWKKIESGYTMYVRFSEFAQSWVITCTLDDDTMQTVPYLSKTTYTNDPWDGTTWNVSLDATTCELTLTT